MTSLDSSDFWSPEFTYENRLDGSILMMQTGELSVDIQTIAEYLDKWADETPDHPWLARRENKNGDWVKISYGSAHRQAQAIGASLLELGLGPNRPLLILSENSLEHALLGIACAYVGIPYCPVSPAYSLRSADHSKLKDVVANLKPSAIFADDGAAFETAIHSINSNEASVINVVNAVDGAILFDTLLTGDPAKATKARSGVSAETVVKYLLTSGSTGSPKAVINTNKMICAMQAMVRDCYRFLSKAPPVVLNWAPWNHTAGGNKVFYLVLANGGTYYIDDGRPVPGLFDQTLRNLRDIPTTWHFNVPVAYGLLVDELEKDPKLASTFFKNLGMMFYAGAGMPQHTWDRLRAAGRKATGREVLLAAGLGATETAPVAFSCTTVQENAGNVGVPSLGLMLKLVPFGDKLEARLKGPTITPGYYGDPAKTAEAFDEEGFYCLGDALRPADPNDLSKGFFFDGRIAENFKLTTGTWVAVGSVRAKLIDAMDGLIHDAVIVGENEASVGALILLSKDAKAKPLDEVRKLISEKLKVASKAATGSASRVSRAIILSGEPSFDRGEITEKGSLNQRAMRNNNTLAIKALYGDMLDVIKI